MKKEFRKFLAQCFWIETVIIMIQCIGLAYEINGWGDLSPRDIISIILLILFFGFIAIIINVLLFCLYYTIGLRVKDFFEKKGKILKKHSMKRESKKYFCTKCGTEIISGDSFCFECRKTAVINREDIRTYIDKRSNFI